MTARDMTARNSATGKIMKIWNRNFSAPPGRAAAGGALMFLISFTALAAAYVAEYGYGLKPCELCLYQRVPYWTAMPLGLAILFLAKRHPRPAAILTMAGAVIFAAGAAIAFYHTGVEYHWWRSFLEGCSVSLNAGSIDDLMAQIQATPAVRCDAAAWRDPVLGLSMAGWNAVLSFIFSVFFLTHAVMIRRRTTKILSA